MLSKLTFRSIFDASHEGEHPPMVCGNGLHGHEWTVQATFLYDPINDVSFPRNVFEETVEELDERHLNDMIKPSMPSTWGVAHWVMDRLASRTRVESVEVMVNTESVVVIADEVRRK